MGLHDATVTGGGYVTETSLSSTNNAGNFGSCWHCTGTGQGVHVAITPTPAPFDIFAVASPVGTVRMRFRIPSIPSDPISLIYLNGTGSYISVQVAQTTGYLQLYFQGTPASGGTNVCDGNWHELLLVAGGPTYKVAVALDGTRVLTNPYGATALSAVVNADFGIDTNGNAFAIDEIVVYNAALSSYAVLTSPENPNGANVTGCWSLESNGFDDVGALVAAVATIGAVNYQHIQASAAAATQGNPPYAYQWYRSTTTGFTPGGGNILTGQTALTLDDATTAPSTTYYYKLVTTDSALNTAISNQITGTTPAIMVAPTPTLGTVTYLQVQASVAATTGGSGGYTYQWHRSLTTGFTPAIGTVLAGQTSRTALADTTVLPGHTYYYKMVTTDSALDTIASAQISAAVPYAPMTGLVATVGPFTNSAVLLYSTPAGGGAPPYTYQWYRSTTSGFTPGGGNILTGQTALAIRDGTVAAATTYYYKVVATDSVATTLTSTQVSVTTPALALTAGTAALSSTGTTTASLTVGVATGGSSPYSYQWYRSTVYGFTPGAGNILSGKTSTTLSDTGLTAGTTYYYVCKATDNVSAVVFSNQVTATTTSTQTTGYPNLCFLQAGDLLQSNGANTPDMVPASGDYLHLDGGGTYMIDSIGLGMPVTVQPASVSGPPLRMPAIRTLPNRQMTLNLNVQTGGTDLTSVWAGSQAIEQKLEQARAAAAGYGHGPGIVLAIRFATNGNTAFQTAFTRFDVLDGRLSPVDKGVLPSQVYGFALTLDCLPYGRNTPVVWPASGTSATVTNGSPGVLYIGQAVPAWIGSGTAVGSVAGTVGALIQLRIKDVSTAGVIQRLRIGRKALAGPSGGMAEPDWSGVANATNLYPGTLLTGQSNAVNSDFARLTATDGGWYDAARVSSGTSAPIAEPGLYDVLVRVKEGAHAAVQPSAITASLTTLSSGVVASPVLIPDSYTVRLVGNSTSPSTAASAPTAALQVTTAYPWTPDLCAIDFETATLEDFLSVTGSGSFATGTQDVTPDAAIAGTYGLRVTCNAAFPNVAESASNINQQYQNWIQHTFSAPAATSIYAACWLRFNGAIPTSTAWTTIMTLNASALEAAMQRMISTSAYVYNGWLNGGDMAMIGLSGGQLVLAGHAQHGYTPQTAAFTGLAMSDLQYPCWVVLSMNQSTQAYNVSYTLNATIYTVHGTYAATLPNVYYIDATDGTYPTMPQSVETNTAIFGVRITEGAAVLNIDYDDCRAWSSASTFYTPNQGIALAYTDPNNALATVYLQQNSQSPVVTTAALAQRAVLCLTDLDLPGTIPTSAVPVPSQIRGRYSVLPDALYPAPNVRYTQPVSTQLQDNQWHILNLGTIHLPPSARPQTALGHSGTVYGDLGWLLDLQVASGSGSTSNTVDLDAVWLFPHGEPQIVATFPGMAGTTLLEWDLETRADGRSFCTLRDSAGNIVGSASTIGYLLLAPGNQSLLVLAERENGVHDVTNTKLQFGAVITPLSWSFLDQAVY